ncbi:MAG: UpxY family transcription antiterminator [Rikenellaceae bacterium]
MIIDRVNTPPNESVWFAMQATHNREQKAQERLQRDGIESFVPMCTKIEGRGRVKKMVAAPAVPNLMFVHAPISYMRDIKSNIPYLQFKYEVEQGSYRPIVVPTKEMEDFMTLYNSSELTQKRYLDPYDPSLSKGERVRLHCGSSAIDGIEGVLVKIKGRRERQLAISVGNFVTLIAAVDIDVVEIVCDRCK